jgi:hypothetical protein
MLAAWLDSLALKLRGSSARLKRLTSISLIGQHPLDFVYSWKGHAGPLGQSLFDHFDQKANSMTQLFCMDVLLVL